MTTKMRATCESTTKVVSAPKKSFTTEHSIAEYFEVSWNINPVFDALFKLKRSIGSVDVESDVKYSGHEVGRWVQVFADLYHNNPDILSSVHFHELNKMGFGSIIPGAPRSLSKVDVRALKLENSLMYRLFNR